MKVCSLVSVLSLAAAPLCEMPPLIPATIWTRKNINEFKEAVRKNPENVIRVGSLSTATVSRATLLDNAVVFKEKWRI